MLSPLPSSHKQNSPSGNQVDAKREKSIPMHPKTITRTICEIDRE